MAIPSASTLPEQLLNFFQTSVTNYFLLNGNNIDDKMSFLQEVSETLAFPKTFGFNWDGLSDYLMDMSWFNNDSAFLIVYKNSHNFRLNSPEEWDVANEIIMDAMDYWHKQARPMIIIFL